MSNPVDKDDLRPMVEEALRDIHTAILNHPPETVQVWEENQGIIESNVSGAHETDLTKSQGLTVADLQLIHRYLYAASFMSAWFHAHGDKERRDTAAQTAAMLISGFGLAPDDVMKSLVGIEQQWRGEFRRHGIGRKGGWGCMVVVIVVGVVLYFIFR